MKRLLLKLDVRRATWSADARAAGRWTRRPTLNVLSPAPTASSAETCVVALLSEPAVRVLAVDRESQRRREELDRRSPAPMPSSTWPASIGRRVPEDFEQRQRGLDRALCCDAVRDAGRALPIVVRIVHPGRARQPLRALSKRRRRGACSALAAARPAPGVQVFRLPDVFGKWCRPNYNSVVATFCHNIARGLPIDSRRPAAGDRAGPRRRRGRGRFIALPRRRACPTRARFARGARLPRSPSASWPTDPGLPRQSAKSLDRPDLATVSTARCYATYLSYLPPEALRVRGLDNTGRAGRAGRVAEVAATCGQIFLFAAQPGDHPRRTTTTTQGREVPGGRGRGA